jgi:hypothetical protein
MKVLLPKEVLLMNTKFQRMARSSVASKLCLERWGNIRVGGEVEDTLENKKIIFQLKF